MHSTDRSPQISLSTKVPEKVVQQLRMRYARTGITMRNQILQALQAAGIEVDDHEIKDERKYRGLNKFADREERSAA